MSGSPLHFVNYHRHTHISNTYIADSVVTNEDYAKRAVELGHQVISSCEHGTQGNYREAFSLAQKYGLKWRYAAEVYFVVNRHEKDNTNAHMIVAAKTEKGIGDLNEAISEANISGYYYRPRIDLEILLSLNPKDVFVTTSCIGGIYRYGTEEAENLIKMLHDHFGDSMMLEVQAHHTEKQVEANRFFLKMYRKYNIPLIAGMDSHFIYPEQAELRDIRLEANNIIYEDEQGWFLDYCDGETFAQRFREQGVLSEAQIMEAINNTNIFLTFEDVVFDRSRKLPPLYPDKTQEERNEIYRQMVYRSFEEAAKDMSPEERAVREEGLKYEVDTIVETNTSDYFLINQKIIELGIQKGGDITKTGRGSGPSYYSNSLLGFSSIDRFDIPVTLYPDRFISKDRLASGSLPDIDQNCGDTEPFIAAQKEVLGEWNSAPMVAFGTLQISSAWKMYCRAVDVPFEIANAISAKIKEYELAVKHADDDEKEDIDIADFVDEGYLDTLNESRKFKDIIDSIAPHPCAHVLSANDIRREFGVYRINSGSGKKKKIVYAAYIDGATADAFGYLKNDLLTVDVVNVNARAWKRIGKPMPSVKELMELTKADKKTWQMYSKGYTVGLNQVEKPKATQKIMQYKPRNISELSAFVAGIRPSFQSMIGYLLSRTRFVYNIPALDKLIQTEEMKSSFLLYQEQLMTILQYAGFTPPESYSAIKAISKKHPEKVKVLREQFLDGFYKHLMSEGGVSDDVAQKTADDVWQIISDACNYGFNASHAVCVALDSLYGAYTKANYPYEYYIAMLEVYGDKGKKPKLALIKDEMRKAFGIKIAPCKFRQDNRDYFVDKDNKTVSDALSSVKFMNKAIPERLYKMGSYFGGDFIDLLVEMENDPVFDARKVDILIRMGYFSEFGTPLKLIRAADEFRNGKNRYTKTLIDSTKEARMDVLKSEFSGYDDGELTIGQKMQFEIDIFGQPMSVFPEARGMFCVLDVDEKYSPKVNLYSISTGDSGVMKVLKKRYLAEPLKPGQVIKLNKWQKKPAYQYIGGKMERRGNETELWMDDYTVI